MSRKLAGAALVLLGTWSGVALGAREATNDASGPEEELAPTVPSAVPGDFAPVTAPLGMASAQPTSVLPPVPAPAPVPSAAARPPEGPGLLMFVAPAAAAILAVLWVLARRRSHEPRPLSLSPPSSSGSSLIPPSSRTALSVPSQPVSSVPSQPVSSVPSQLVSSVPSQLVSSVPSQPVPSKPAQSVARISIPAVMPPKPPVPVSSGPPSTRVSASSLLAATPSPSGPVSTKPSAAVVPAAPSSKSVVADIGEVEARPTPDGFWLKAPAAPHSTRVRYACIVDGQEVSDVAPISRGVETFVHTGRPPSEIRVTELPKEEVERASTPSRPPFLAVIATEERGDDD